MGNYSARTSRQVSALRRSQGQGFAGRGRGTGAAFIDDGKTDVRATVDLLTGRSRQLPKLCRVGRVIIRRPGLSVGHGTTGIGVAQVLAVPDELSSGSIGAQP